MSPTQPKAGNAESRPPIVRPLGKMERSLWFCDQCSPANIAVGGEIRGEVTDEALRRALRWCQIRHPILRSVIRPGNKTVSFACYAPENAPAIPLEITAGSSEDEDQVVTAEMRKPFAGTEGLLIRAKLLRLGKNRAFLNLAFSHVIGDGFSAVLLLQDILRCLGRIARQETLADPTPLPFPPPSEEGIAAEHRGWAGFKKLLAFQKEVAADLKRHGAKPSPVRVQTHPPFADRQVKIKSFSLTEADTAALVARSKAEKVSVYSLLSAALVDSFQPLLEPAKKPEPGPNRVISIAAPVDMRPFLTPAVKDYFGFYSSAVNQLCLVQAVNDIPALAKQLQADLKRSFVQKKVHLHTSPLLASFLSWRWLFPVKDQGVTRVAKLTDGMFKSCATSLTFLNEALSVEEGALVSLVRPRGHISPSIMGVALYCVLMHQNILTAHLNYNEGQLGDADAELLNQRFKSNLLALGQIGQAA